MFKYKQCYLLLAALALISFCSCTTVRPYQMQYLKDYSMQTNALSLEKLENEADSYREGAAGGTGGKSGGGCGCN